MNDERDVTKQFATAVENAEDGQWVWLQLLLP